jgi:hypothetical protein
MVYSRRKFFPLRFTATTLPNRPDILPKVLDSNSAIVFSIKPFVYIQHKDSTEEGINFIYLASLTFWRVIVTS